MSLDTASKRFSLMHLACPWRMTLPLPDGTLDAGDRQQVLWQCSAQAFSGGGGTITPVFGMEPPAIFGGRIIR